MRFLLLTFVGVFLSAAPVSAQVVGDKDLQDTLGDVELVGSWIYDDLKAGFKEAERTKKPLLVVLRCVP